RRRPAQPHGVLASAARERAGLVAAAAQRRGIDALDRRTLEEESGGFRLGRVVLDREHAPALSHRPRRLQGRSEGRHGRDRLLASPRFPETGLRVGGRRRFDRLGFLPRRGRARRGRDLARADAVDPPARARGLHARQEAVGARRPPIREEAPMRVWDLPPRILCRQHLLGEHLELHAIWAVLTKGRKGYSRHPETLRWKGKLKALYKRHELQVE